MVAKSQAAKLGPVIRHEMHWELIDEYLAVEMDRIVTLLVSCTPEEVRKLQGQYDALKKLRNMPLTLKSE